MPEPAPLGGAQPRPRGDEPGADVNILIVDDQPHSLVALAAVLEGEGRRVVRATSGREALQHVLRDDFAVIVLDVNMPGMDGFETAALIHGRDRTRHVPIIFLTASESGSRVLQGYAAGAVDYILKPCDPAVLRSKVAVFIDLFKKTEEVERQAAALRESEARYRDLFENASDLIQAVGPDGRFLYVNRAWRDTLGYTAGEVAGLSVLDVIHPDARPHWAAVFTRLMAGEAVGTVEATLVTKTGAAVQVEGSINGGLADGRGVATRGMFRDVTERKRAEAARAQEEAVRQELAKRDAEAEALRRVNRLKDELLSTISHELRTPLALIHGYAQRLQRRAGALDPAAVEATAERILAGSTQLTRLVEELLDFARMERGEVVVQPEAFDLAPTLREVAEGFRRREGGGRLACEVPAALPVRADRARVAQVVANLVENAVKYAPAGPIVLRAARRPPGPSDGTGLVRVEVEDHGPGILPDEQERVWEKFYRGASVAQLHLARGTGIGLAVVKALVEAQGGRVGLESAPDRGARFWFELPAAAPRPTRDGAGDPAGRAAAGPPDASPPSAAAGALVVGKQGGREG